MELTQGVRFDTLELSPEILRALMERNIVQSTPVQAGCIPPMLEWRDVIAKAPTGTGKTFAYGIPIVEHIDPEDESVQAVILAPTRELAIQITDELRILYTYKPGIRAVCLYGGAPIGRQIDALKKHPQIVVATPGRLSDYMKRRTVRVDTAKTVVLDEADRMLDMGFIHDVTRLLDRMDKRKNLGLFSATISREVMDIAWVYQRDAEEDTVREDEQNKPDIKQFRMDVSFDGKAEAIAKILNETGFDRCMVFCNTKGNTERITKFLQMRGIDAQCIHGDIPQKKREQVMDLFRKGNLRVFVSTDVAARGIDVDDVDIVFNCDIPDENQDYVHRIGRTGRAKRQGVAVSFVADFPSKIRIDDIAKNTRNEILPVKFDENGSLTIDGVTVIETGLDREIWEYNRYYRPELWLDNDRLVISSNYYRYSNDYGIFTLSTGEVTWMNLGKMNGNGNGLSGIRLLDGKLCWTAREVFFTDDESGSVSEMAFYSLPVEELPYGTPTRMATKLYYGMEHNGRLWTAETNYTATGHLTVRAFDPESGESAELDIPVAEWLDGVEQSRSWTCNAIKMTAQGMVLRGTQYMENDNYGTDWIILVPHALLDNMEWQRLPSVLDSAEEMPLTEIEEVFGGQWRDLSYDEGYTLTIYREGDALYCRWADMEPQQLVKAYKTGKTGYYITTRRADGTTDALALDTGKPKDNKITAMLYEWRNLTYQGEA